MESEKAKSDRLARQREYYLKHRDKMLAYSRKYRLEHPEKMKLYKENAAKILFDCAERLPNTLLPELLAWLQDLNWPGANIITNLMVKINSEPTQLQLEKVIQQATIEKDEEWLENLITLQHRLKN